MEILGQKEVAKYLKVSIRTVIRMRKRGEIKPCLGPKHYYIYREEDLVEVKKLIKKRKKIRPGIFSQYSVTF